AGPLGLAARTPPPAARTPDVPRPPRRLRRPRPARLPAVVPVRPRWRNLPAMSPVPAPRHRIKGHRRVRAGDLVPHELHPRRHPEAQRAALAALYEEIGFARSLLAYELPDGRLKLIDGHLRQSLDPDLEVEVEVLDVNDEEARKLLLSLDPLVLLAEYD